MFALMEQALKCRDLSCPLCYAGVRGRKAYKGHFGYRSPKSLWRDAGMGLPRRRKDENVELSEFAASMDSAIAVDVPSLCEFLARQCWDDGEVRERGSVLLCAQEGVWKAWVNDKDGNRSAWVSATCLSDLLVLVDQGLDQEALPWRRGSVQEPRKKKS